MTYTLWNEECLSAMKRLPDGSVDMVVCDLPYGKTACKWDTVIPFEPLWAAYRRVCKKNAAIVLTASQPFTSVLIASNLSMFKYCWVWEKSKGSNFQHSKYQPLKVHEDVVVFSSSAAAQGTKTPMNYFPQKVAGKKYKGFNNPIGTIGTMSKGNLVASSEVKGAERCPRSVHYQATAENEGRLHPTQKPVALMEYLIKTYTNEGETVLDNTMGSGTTGVACGNLGRLFIGIERDEKYFQIAQARISAAYSNDDFC